MSEQSRRGAGDGSQSWATTAPALSQGTFDVGETPAGPGPRYERAALLGEGGMGRVWLGYDRALDRQVALKEPLGGADGPAARLLRREAAVAARLEHPGIVVVHDIVEGPAGPMYVMGLVRGRSLSEWLDDEDTSLTRLLAAFADACTAVGHAHQMGVLHRDLSPRNVMVDGDGTAQVVDWGLAISLGEGEPESRPPSSVGTPGFTPPELERGEHATRASDVWSLGQILRRLCEHRSGPHRLELDAIVEQATHEEPTARYADATELASDLRRWLEGRPVEAYDALSWRVVRHTLQTYRAPLAIAALAILSVMASLAWGVRAATLEADRARRAEANAVELAVAEAAATEQANELAEMERRAGADALANRAFDAWQRGDVTNAARLVEASLSRDDVPRARGLLGLLGALPILERERIQRLPPCNQWRMSARWDRTHCVELTDLSLWDGEQRLWSNNFGSLDVRHADDGTMRLIGGPGDVMHIDAETGELLSTDPTPTRFSDPVESYLQRVGDGTDPEGRTPGRVCGGLPGAMLRTGDRFLITCADGGVWQADNQGAEHLPMWRDAWFRALVDAGSLGVWGGSNDGRIRRIDGAMSGFDIGEPVVQMTAIPDSPWMLARTGAGSVRVYDLRRGAHAFDLPHATHDVRVIDRRTIDVVSSGRRARWRLPEVAPLRQFDAPDGITALAFGAASDSLAITDGSGRIHLAMIDDSMVRSEPWLSGVAKSVFALPDGTFLAAGIHSNGIATLDPDVPGPPRPTYNAWGPHTKRVAWLTDGTTLALNYATGVVLPAAGEEPFGVIARSYSFADLEGSLNARYAVAAGQTAYVFAAGSEARELRTGIDEWYAGAIDNEGRVALLGSTFIDLYGPDGELLAHIDDVPRSLDIAFVGRRNAVVVGGRDGAVRVYDLDDGRLVAEAPVHTERVAAVAASPDGRWIASGAWDGAVHMHAVREIFAGDPRASDVIAPLLPQ